MNVREARSLFRRGDEVIIPDTEFLQVAIPWAKLREERGIRLKFVKSHGGAFHAKDFEAVIGRRTKPGAVALKASVDIVNAIGIERVDEHIQNLVDRLIQGLDRLGVRLISPRERKHRAGIVSFRVYRRPEDDAKLVEKLVARKILVSMRYTSRVGGIRVSVHYFNNEDDIDGLLDALRELK